MTDPKKKIAIIGTGLSGLTAAHFLKDYADISLFDKSRGVGGRMSTRRAAPYAFDHGAQFFTAKTEAFKTFIAPMIDTAVIACWEARFAEIKNKKIILQKQWNNAHPHYVGVPAMNAIPKYLSRDLNIQLNTRIKAIARHQSKWYITNENDDVLGEYDWIISAIPPQQALAILPNTLPFYAMINAFKMQACFVLMLGFESNPGLEFDIARIDDSVISCLSTNSSKPGRGKPHSLLIYSTNQWANEHADTDHTQAMNTIYQKVSEMIHLDLTPVVHKTLHKWRYANIEKQRGKTHLLDAKLGVAVCGDWFIQGRVEGAFESGFKAAKQIISILGKHDD